MLESFRTQLTAQEYESIMTLRPNEQAMAEQFQKLWCLKEVRICVVLMGRSE